MSLRELSRDSVNRAMREFDRLGRDAFLEKYGFGKARDYLLTENGSDYDSKAIAGVAHGYLPGRSPLKPEDFGGGKPVIRALSRLGFTVRGPDNDDLPRPGDVLNNDEIGRRFSVGTQGGMRRSTIRNILILISDPFKSLYQDRWEGDTLHYTGMGTSGNQVLSSAQNRTLAESGTNGVAVHLMESREAYRYTYMGKVDLVADPYQEDQPDEQGKPRKVWMFPVRLQEPSLISPITQKQQHSIEESKARIAAKLPLEVLAANAASAPKRAASREARAIVFVRNPSIAEYVKRLANGQCDLCGTSAPFHNRQKKPYLESHHIIWLARSGDDTIENTVALCPNCHRKMHVLDRDNDKQRLRELAAKRKIDS